MNPIRTARRTHGFTESVIREMTRVAREHDSINLAQGFPDFPAPELLKDAACRAIRDDINQYAVTWGSPPLRSALVQKYRDWYGLEIDGDREMTVTCGATEAMAAVLLACIDPRDEVIVFEPFYENYGPDAVLSDARPAFVTLQAPDYRIEAETLHAAVNERTRAIILNTPNNPTGRVFDPGEMQVVVDLCVERDLLLITDEIYEHIVYDGKHICAATLPGMRDRTIVVSGASKTYSVTGWRVGTIIAPPDLTAAIRKVHDFLTVGAPAPLQEAIAQGMMGLPDAYYESLRSGYQERRDVMVEGLTSAGWSCRAPEGAYYVLADYSAISDEPDDNVFARSLAANGGVATVPGSSFFSSHDPGRRLLRFAFCKRVETLERACERLGAFASAGS